MGIFSRLFRGSPRHEIGETEDTRANAAPAIDDVSGVNKPDIPGGRSGDDEQIAGVPSQADDHSAEHASGSASELPQPAPLRSLERYKKDPAYQNFMDLAKRSPGTRRRSRPDLDPPGRGPGV